jgi:hypothetical protein
VDADALAGPATAMSAQAVASAHNVLDLAIPRPIVTRDPRPCAVSSGSALFACRDARYLSHVELAAGIGTIAAGRREHADA